MNTKERILHESLRLFSEKGYHSVSVRDIGKAVGIKESSIYNHFKSKQDLFDTLVESCWQDAELYFRQSSLPFTTEDDVSDFHNATEQFMLDKVLSIFGYFFKSETNVQFRKLLILSQYESPRAKELYQTMYVDYMLQFQSKLFSGLINSGEFKPQDPMDTAMDFYGPMFLLIHTCGSFEEAKPKIERHLTQFLALHKKGAVNESNCSL